MAVAPDRLLRLASGPKEDVYDALGRGMAELLSRRLPGFKVTVRQTDDPDIRIWRACINRAGARRD
jgi:hypothetical protein